MKILRKFFTVILIIILNISCAEKKQLDYRVTMIGDIGGLVDQSFNQAVWEGLVGLAGSRSDISINNFMSMDELDYADLIRKAAKQPNQFLVLAASYKMANALKEVSKDFPNVRFAIVDNVEEDEILPNVNSLSFRIEEAAYLAGYLAAKVSKKNKLGFVGGGGGTAIVIEKFRYGFEVGAKRAKPDIEIISDYISGYHSVPYATIAAQNVINQGVDVLFPVAGQAGIGAISVAKENNIYLIGVDRDQSLLAPKHMITSVLKKVDIATMDLVTKLVNQEEPRSQIILGLKENAVGLAPINKNIVVDKDVIDQLARLEKEIISGKVQLTRNSF